MECSWEWQQWASQGNKPSPSGAVPSPHGGPAPGSAGPPVLPAAAVPPAAAAAPHPVPALSPGPPRRLSAAAVPLQSDRCIWDWPKGLTPWNPLWPVWTLLELQPPALRMLCKLQGQSPTAGHVSRLRPGPGAGEAIHGAWSGVGWAGPPCDPRLSLGAGWEAGWAGLPLRDNSGRTHSAQGAPGPRCRSSSWRGGQWDQATQKEPFGAAWREAEAAGAPCRACRARWALWASPSSFSRCTCSCSARCWASRRLLSSTSRWALRRRVGRWVSHPPAGARRVDRGHPHVQCKNQLGPTQNVSGGLKAKRKHKTTQELRTVEVAEKTQGVFQDLKKDTKPGRQGN